MTATSTPRAIAESYWQAECAHDLTAVLDHYHANATFCPPSKRLVGHEQIRTFYEEAFRRFGGLEVEILSEITDGNRSCLEWRAILIEAAGKRHELLGVNVIQVRGGKYEQVNTYFDPTLLMG